jgi:hypothetical protein
VGVRKSYLMPALAVGALMLLVAFVLGALVLAPRRSVVAAGSCSRFDVVCLADAHPGVMSFITLLLGLAAGVIAYRTLRVEALAQARVRADDVQQQHRYVGLLRETLYETVHNLRHLATEIDWEAPADPRANEYSGCKLERLPVLDVRYLQRLLDVPYVERLEGEAPALLGFFDHALRNIRYIERDPARPQAVAREASWLVEHLLRALVCSRYRAAGPPAEQARKVLGSAKLDSVLDPGEEHGGVETELRDRVRLVKLAEGDGRDLPTVIACFAPDGTPTPLMDWLREMPDPPPRAR